MKSSRYKFLALFLIAVVSLSASEDCCEGYDPAVSTITIRHREAGGIGYDSGYTTLEGLFFFGGVCENIYPFVDLRGHYLNDNEWAANGGIGARFAPCESRFVYGINAYFDYRSDESRSIHFTQAGIGFEVIGCRIDIRANGYFPIKNSHTIQECRTFYEGGYFVFRDRLRHAFNGGDLEVGFYLNGRPQCIEFYAAIGGYFYGSDVYRKPAGGRFRLLMTYSDYVSLQGIVTHDNVFGTRVQGEVAFHIPFGCCPPPCFCIRERNISKRVYRNDILPLDEFCCWKFNY